MRWVMTLRFLVLCASIACALFGCSDATMEPPYTPPELPDSGLDGAIGLDGSPAKDGSLVRDAEASDAAAAPSDAAFDTAAVATCAVPFRWVQPVGERPRAAAVAGSFNAFQLPGTVLQGPDADGAFSTTLSLAPGEYAYKLVVDGVWRMDDAEGKRIYAGGVENSMLEVADCNNPGLRVVSTQTYLVTAVAGRFSAWLRASVSATGAPLASATVVDRHNFVANTLAADSFDPASGWLHVNVRNLAVGKHSIDVSVRDRAGRTSAVLHLVTWVEAAPFQWNDAVIYMAMVDRFADGDPISNAQPTANVERRADFQGGDLWGVRDQIRAGTFDRLGVRALWLSPFHTNPAGAYPAAHPNTSVTGYHGYWPVKAREVDPRIGGEAALKALVTEAHAHGIRVLQDFVVNHVHEQHEYVQSHPQWFRTGCVCGTSSCDWTSRRLDCLFASYLPDVNWTVPAAAKAFVEDASYWLDTFDLDGLRVDAVKHVEDVAVRNLVAMARSRFEGAGTRMFLTGETAMGWNECQAPNCPGNDENYGTINRYLGPKGLDGQFDFVLFHAAATSVFAYEDRGLGHADYWLKASLTSYPADAIMTAYVGSHDTSRFTTVSTYRGQSGLGRGDAFRQWDAPTVAPADAEAFGRTRLGFAWLMTIPGAPLLYYGDEYGEVGASDPNNRTLWRGAGTLSAQEGETRRFIEALGTARQALSALRRGGYRSLAATDDFLAFSRDVPNGDTVIVALARTAGVRRVVLPPGLAARWPASVRERLGGAAISTAGGVLELNVSAHGAMVISP